MDAIPDAGGARCAPRGMLRALPGALLRVAMLGGLVIAGCLLGSGIAQASAFSGLSGVNEVRIAPLSPLNATETDEDPGGLLGESGAIGSTVAGVMRVVPAPRLPVQPAQLPVLKPVLKPVSKLAAPAAPQAGKTAKSRAAADKPTVVTPPAAPAEPVAAATTVTTPAPVPHTVREAAPETPACLAAAPVADPLADRFTGPTTLGPSAWTSGPAEPVRPSSPGTTTAPCPVGSTGGGSTITKSLHSVTLSDEWAAMGLTPTHCRLCAGADGIPPSAAQRPSTSPD